MKTTFKVKVVDAPVPPFVGTAIRYVATEESLKAGIYQAALSEGCESVTVDWGDGTVVEIARDVSQLAHAYAQAGTYEIRISDDIAGLAFCATDSRLPYTSVYPLQVLGVRSNARRLRALDFNAFRGCANLASLDFADSAVTSFGMYAFSGCSSLVRIDRLPRGLVTLEQNAFNKCSALASIGNFPPGVAELKSGVFANCTALRGELSFPYVTAIRGSGTAVPFRGATGGITKFRFSSANEASIRASSGYMADPTLGTGTAECVFDLP